MIRVRSDITKEELQEIKARSFEVDLHDLLLEDALAKIRYIVRFAPKTTRGIYVVHGYNQGTAIKRALTVKNLRSKRVKCINPVYQNKGQSVIVFKGFKSDLEKHVLFDKY